MISSDYGHLLDEWREKTARKQELGGELRLVEDELRDCKDQQQAGRLKRRRAELCQKLTEVKAWICRHSEGPKQQVRLVVPGMVEEYDLRNALAEPQNLLQRALVCLEAVSKRTGITEKDRSVIDSIRDYLQRHGVLL